MIVVKIRVLWDIAKSGLINRYRLFRGEGCVHLQDPRIQREITSLSLSPIDTLFTTVGSSYLRYTFLYKAIFLVLLGPWRCRQKSTPKRLWVFANRHGYVSQKPQIVNRLLVYYCCHVNSSGSYADSTPCSLTLVQLVTFLLLCYYLKAWDFSGFHGGFWSCDGLDGLQHRVVVKCFLDTPRRLAITYLKTS